MLKIIVILGRGKMLQEIITSKYHCWSSKVTQQDAAGAKATAQLPHTCAYLLDKFAVKLCVSDLYSMHITDEL